MRKLVLALLILIPAGLLVWVFAGKSRLAEVGFAKIRRETLVSTVQTNGKVEPLEWVAVRAGREGTIKEIHAEKGQPVVKGALIAELEIHGERAELAAAEARIAEAKSDAEMLDRGGRKSELVAIGNDLAVAKAELETAARELASLKRLRAKQAATGLEVDKAEERVRAVRVRIESLDRKRQALVSPVDRRAAQARLGAAEAEAVRARRRIETAAIRAPMSGTLYDLDVRPGSYVTSGDLVAKIGALDRMRVVIYVDEPDLGRVAEGMPVTITWDALPGRQWKGMVEKTPTEVVPLGTRKVGQVIGVIENPDSELPPGANINAAIRSRVAENALTVPKEVLRRAGGEVGVFLLSGETVRWRPVELGASSITRAEVVTGLSDGDAVALPAERPLHDGDRVSAVVR